MYPFQLALRAIFQACIGAVVQAKKILLNCRPAGRRHAARAAPVPGRGRRRGRRAVPGGGRQAPRQRRPARRRRPPFPGDGARAGRAQQPLREGRRFVKGGFG